MKRIWHAAKPVVTTSEEYNDDDDDGDGDNGTPLITLPLLLKNVQSRVYDNITYKQTRKRASFYCYKDKYISTCVHSFIMSTVTNYGEFNVYKAEIPSKDCQNNHA